MIIPTRRNRRRISCELHDRGSRGRTRIERRFTTEAQRHEENIRDCFSPCLCASVVKIIMNFENILLEKKNSIAYVTVNRPKVLNALNMATMEELRAAFHDIKNDQSVRVVIFTGSGEKAFIAGADIGELAKHDAVSGKEYTHRGQSVLNLIENLGKPVI